MKEYIKPAQMGVKTVMLGGLLFASSISSAALNCQKVTNNLHSMDCIQQQFYLSAKALELKQDILESSITSAYSADRKLAMALLSATREAQTAWLHYRDKQCEVSVFEIEEGSPAYETSKQACMIGLNQQRIEQLEVLAHNYE